MGTYTTNYNLFMPTVGEQGWGDLVNGNFTTIDTTMKGLDTRTGTLESEMNAVEERITALEPLSIIQVDENQNVTFPAKITASEFVGGVGNFTSLELANGIDGNLIKMPTLSYKGYYTTSKNGGSAVSNVTLFSTPFPISGVVSVRALGMAASNPPLLIIISTSGRVTHNLTSVQTEYTVTNAFLIYCLDVYNGSEFSVGVPKLV